MKIDCNLVTVWDSGTEIRTAAHYNLQTGEVTSRESVDADVEVLEREYIEFQSGSGLQGAPDETLDVCKTCHEYVLKSVMLPDAVGKGLSEHQVCSNPECESHQ